MALDYPESLNNVKNSFHFSDKLNKITTYIYNMNDGPSYCSKCGAQLIESDSFCVRCGAKIEELSSSAPAYVQPVSSKRSTVLWIIIVLGLIWTVIAILTSIEAFFETEAIAEMVDPGPFDIQFIKSMVIALGVMFLISGIMSLITAVLAFVRKFHTAALVCCIFGSILAVISLVGIIGLILAYFLYKAKNEFIS